MLLSFLQLNHIFAQRVAVHFSKSVLRGLQGHQEIQEKGANKDYEESKVERTRVLFVRQDPKVLRGLKVCPVKRDFLE